MGHMVTWKGILQKYQRWLTGKGKSWWG